MLWLSNLRFSNVRMGDEDLSEEVGSLLLLLEVLLVFRVVAVLMREAQVFADCGLLGLEEIDFVLVPALFTLAGMDIKSLTQWV